VDSGGVGHQLEIGHAAIDKLDLIHVSLIEIPKKLNHLYVSHYQKC
jgi:hypothetical protein